MRIAIAAGRGEQLLLPLDQLRPSILVLSGEPVLEAALHHALQFGLNPFELGVRVRHQGILWVVDGRRRSPLVGELRRHTGAILSDPAREKGADRAADDGRNLYILSRVRDRYS